MKRSRVQAAKNVGLKGSKRILKQNKTDLLSNRIWNFIKTTGIQFLAGGIIGILIGMVFILKDFSLPAEYAVLPFYINILIAVITYIVLIAVHELSHFFVFVRNNIKMRALFLMVFMIIKENGSWNFRFKPNKVTAIGGIAIPDVDVVKNEESFKKIQIAFSKVLIAGPTASMLFALISTAIIVPGMLIIENIYLKSILFTMVSSIVVFTFFIIITSFFKNEMVIGDFPAYKMASTDDFFVAMQFYQYAVFSSEFERVRSENNFIKSVICDGLSRKLAEKNFHVYTLQIIDSLLVEYLAGVSKTLPEIINDYVDFLIDNDKAFDMIKNSEQAMVLWFHIVRLLYLDRRKKDKAVEVFEDMKRMLKKKTPVTKYMIKQAEHLLGIKDNSEYLMNKNNINISSADGLFKNFKGYYADEMRLNSIIQ